MELVDLFDPWDLDNVIEYCLLALTHGIADVNHQIIPLEK